MNKSPLPRGIGYTLGIITGLILGIITGFALENLAMGLALGPGMGFSMGLALEGEKNNPIPPKQQKVVRNIAIAGVIVLSIIVILSISWMKLI